jgi:hypothetical protein
MKFRKLGILIIIAVVWVLLIPSFGTLVGNEVYAQIPTVSLPTVTGSPQGPTVSVRRDADQDSINVRAGPSAKYDIIGVLIVGQIAPARGRTPGGDWVQIFYPGVPDSTGWVYSPLVEVNGSLPIVEPPPTPTPRTTPTVNPTLAAQFILEIPPTRLPTYTAPSPLVIPTFTAEEIPRIPAGIPMGVVIIGMGVLGVFGILISFLRGN